MAVVSLHAHRPMAPRGERTRRLVGGLEGDGWEVSVVAPPPTVSTSGAAGSGSSNAARRLAARAVAWVLLDKWEPWAARRLLRWEPEIDAALLIAYPFSPVTYAARRLRARGIPYVVDAGDPWILTNPSPYSRGLARHRALRAERKLWEGAAGAVLTTPAQAERLGARFPDLPVLIRPNGYDPSPVSAPARRSAPGTLRIAHFGMLSTERLDLVPLFASLQASGLWQRVVFDQFGDDFVGLIEQLPPGVDGARHDSEPWERVLETARDYDLALVVGNVNPGQLPSKAVQYQTLPIPRVAFTVGSREDALATYVEKRSGWLVLKPGLPDPAQRLSHHLARAWSPQDLQPPPEESWPSVVEQEVGFFDRLVR